MKTELEDQDIDRTAKVREGRKVTGRHRMLNPLCPLMALQDKGFQGVCP